MHAFGQNPNEGTNSDVCVTGLRKKRKKMMKRHGVVQENAKLPCFLEIFQAGPSSDRSTSICLSLVALPNVICVNTG